MLVSHVYLLSTVIWKVWGPGSMGLDGESPAVGHLPTCAVDGFFL
jgi:hypothetical protein